MKNYRSLYVFALLLGLAASLALPVWAADQSVETEPAAEPAPAEGEAPELELLPEPDPMMGPPACKNKDKFTTFSLFVLSQAECEAFCESSCAAGGGTVISVSWVFRSLDCGCTCCKT